MRETIAASTRQPRSWTRSVLLTGVAFSLAVLSLVQARPAAADLEDSSRAAAKMAVARRDVAMKAVTTAKPAPAKAIPAARPKVEPMKPAASASPITPAAAATRGDPRFDEARRRYAATIGITPGEAG